MAKKLFEGKLANGIAIEVLEAESFTGKTEFAVIVAGEVASVSSVSTLRTGDISVKTTTKPLRIKAEAEVTHTHGPTLSDLG